MKERLEISTKDRINYSSTSSHNCEVPLTRTFNQIKSVKLLNAQIPLTYSIINSTCNRIKTSLGTAVLNNGNYSITELITEMRTQLGTATSATWTITYNDKTNKLTFTCSLSFSFLFSDTTNTMCYMLGFPNLDTTAGLTITSPRSINITGELNIYLRIKDLLNPSSYTATHNYFNFKIPITKNYNEIEFYTNQGEENIENCENVKTLYKISIELLKYDGTYLDLNNSDFYFLLEIDF